MVSLVAVCATQLFQPACAYRSSKGSSIDRFIMPKTLVYPPVGCVARSPTLPQEVPVSDGERGVESDCLRKQVSLPVK